MELKFFNKKIKFNTHIRDSIELFLANSSFSKIIAKRNRSIIFTRAITRKIIDRYDGSKYHQINYATGNLGYGLIHYAFLLVIKPKRILCVGSRMGYIPAICALACQENNKGFVDFVDAGYDQDNPNHWGGNGFWKKVDPNKHFSFLDVNQYLKTYVMTSETFANKYKHQYDYIYIDADHSYKGVKNDFRLFWSKLRKNGFMVFHDITVKKEEGVPPFGVWKFWKEIKNKNKISFNYPISGLGILQKS